MSAPTAVIDKPDVLRCGCCGRQLPARGVTELGMTPGVFICAGCAVWAARRAGLASALRRAPVRVLGLLAERVRPHRSATVAKSAVPILPSADLDRTAAFYTSIGYTEGHHDDGYVVLHNGHAELHFSHQTDAAPSECFIHVDNAAALWKLFYAQASMAWDRSRTTSTTCASSSSPTRTATASGSAAPSTRPTPATAVAE